LPSLDASKLEVKDRFVVPAIGLAAFRGGSRPLWLTLALAKSFSELLLSTAASNSSSTYSSLSSTSSFSASFF